MAISKLEQLKNLNRQRKQKDREERAKRRVACSRCNKSFDTKKLKSSHIDGVPYCEVCSVQVIKEKENKRATVTTDQIRNIVVTTTHALPGYEIVKYLDPITVQVVMGVSFFKDISASIDSFIGGRSAALERELSSAYIYAIALLSG